MDSDFPEYIFDYIKPNKIDLANYEKCGCGIMFPNRLVLLNKSDSLDEQILTLLHESLHLHPDFITYTGALFSGYRRDENIEKKIEMRARILKKERPDIVSRLKIILEEAKLHRLNKEF